MCHWTPRVPAKWDLNPSSSKQHAWVWQMTDHDMTKWVAIGGNACARAIPPNTTMLSVQKKWKTRDQTFVYILSNIDRFLKFLQRHTWRKTCEKTIIKDSPTPRIRRYTTAHTKHARLQHSVSQGSVAMHLRCGGSFDDIFVSNYQVNMPEKDLWFGGMFFDSQCAYNKFISCYNISH